MATNKALRDALLEKLGITQQGLSARVQVKKKALPITTEEAVYLIAFDEGIKIDKYLSSDEISAVRHLHTQAVGSQSNSTVATPKRKTRARTRSSGDHREIRFPNEFKATDPLLSVTKLNEAKAMAAVYPLLYVLENSIRELVKRVMRANHGDDWWDTELTSSKLKAVKKSAADRMKTETKNAWHQTRGDHPIDYIDFKDLGTIFRAKKSLFHPAIITDWEWFLNFLKELYPSRNVVAHMNPLLSENVSDVKLRFRKWERVVKSALDEIPT